jgi:uncharacterized protein
MGSVAEHPATTTLGIDLRSGPRYPTGLAVMDTDRRLRWLGVVRSDEEIDAAVVRFAPACIAIDAPLGLPEGRCCVEPACACAVHGIMREADRVCAAAGFRPFPTLLPSMVKLTLRGIALHQTLSARGHRVIEVYPGMAQDILSIPRKRSGVAELRRGLKRRGVRGIPRGRRVSHDELDAATCAQARPRRWGRACPCRWCCPAARPRQPTLGAGRSHTMPRMASDAQIHELIEKMREERATLLAVARTLDEASAEQRPPDGDGEDAWSAKEQLSHLAQMEVGYRAWVERALVEDRPDVATGTHPDPVSYPLERAHEATVAQHLEELRLQRERTQSLIARLSPDQYERTARNATFGELTVLQWLRSYYRHDRMHAAQIQGRQSDYRPRFLSGEPDQRRRS